jgi:uncharacterized protein YggE
MRDAVLAGGADAAALTTTNVSLNPVHDPWPTVVAYEASLGLSVRLLDLTRVGSLLVAAVDAGGDGARVDGITFSHHDAARSSARRATPRSPTRAPRPSSTPGWRGRPSARCGTSSKAVPAAPSARGGA